MIDHGKPTAAPVVAPEVALWRAVLRQAILDSRYAGREVRSWCESPAFEVVADFAGVKGRVARERLRRAIQTDRQSPATGTDVENSDAGRGFIQGIEAGGWVKGWVNPQ